MGGPLCERCTSSELDGVRVLSSEVVCLRVQQKRKWKCLRWMRKVLGDATRCGVSVVRRHVTTMELSSLDLEGCSLYLGNLRNTAWRDLDTPLFRGF